MALREQVKRCKRKKKCIWTMDTSILLLFKFYRCGLGVSKYEICLAPCLSLVRGNMSLN